MRADESPEAASNDTSAGEGPDFANYRAGRRMDNNDMAAKRHKKPSASRRNRTEDGRWMENAGE